MSGEVTCIQNINSRAVQSWKLAKKGVDYLWIVDLWITCVLYCGLTFGLLGQTLLSFVCVIR